MQSSSESTARSRLALTVAPLQYWWPRERMLAFYAEVADSAADTVVLGEVVCARRRELKLADWLALARELRGAGKEVLLATPTLVMGEADVRLVRELAQQGEFALEAGDASALGVLVQAGDVAFALGPHLNIYSQEALREHAVLGATRWCAPAELALAAVSRINPAQAPVPGRDGPLATEVWAFGRLPLAFSARCFTARHHGLNKDNCDFRCRDDADGMTVRSGDGRDFLCLNGTQVQSAGVHALLETPAALRAAGIDRLRLAPTSSGFARVVELFDALVRDTLPPAGARAALRELELPGELIDGYARARAGMEVLTEEA
jgi:collagenase-like PrtC family protease